MKEAAPKLITLFIIAQLVGIFVLSQYIDFSATQSSGVTQTTGTYAGFEPPQVENESFTFIFFIAAVFIGTAIILLLIKYNLHLFWKLWFFMSIAIALSFAVNAFTYLIVPAYSWVCAIIISTIIAYLKVFKRIKYLHNTSEILLYGGLAAVFVPIIDITSATILLTLITIYDVWAVHKSKHMVTLAQTQIDHNVVAGLTIGNIQEATKNAKTAKTKKKGKSKKIPKQTAAILGGGDLAFPLLFAGATMKLTGDVFSGIAIALGAALGLNILFLLSKPGKFYPAMPFVTIGCFLGLAALYL